MTSNKDRNKRERTETEIKSVSWYQGSLSERGEKIHDEKYLINNVLNQIPSVF